MVVVDDDVTSTTITTSVSTTTTTTATTTTPTATAVKINIKCKTEMDRKLLVAAIEGDIEYLDSIRRSSSVCGIQSHASNNVTTQSSSTRKGNGTKKSTKKIVTISTGIEILRTTVCSSGCTLLHWAAGSNQVNVLKYLTQPIKSKSKSKSRQRQRQKQKEEEDKDDKEESVTNNDNDDDENDDDDDDDDNDDDDNGVVIFKNVNIIVEYKKSYGRTPLHYACRNGSLEAVQYLCLSPYCHAIPDIKAKQGVTPFQLAIWQNHLQVCQFLTTSAVGIVPSIDFNDFGCGAIHWIGIAPKHRANFTTTTTNNNNENEDENDNGHDLLPLIKWLSKQDGINFFIKQRQGHTALHKAVWGGHMSVVKYLREEIGMFDDQQDDAGNYAASLADMANTPRHTKIGVYLRQHCSRKRYNSLRILGLTASMSTKSTMSTPTLALDKNEIRKAYLKKARQLHPDRLQVQRLSITNDDDDHDDDNNNQIKGEIITKTPAVAAASTATFDELHQAYIHLTEEDGIGDQVNPAHSLNRMLRYVNSVGSVSVNANVNVNDEKNDNDNDDDEKHDSDNNTNDAGNVDVDVDSDDDYSSFFKARLIAVLLEYGDKGIDLSNVKKKWKQVWPKIPFPSQQQQRQRQYQEDNDDNDDDQKNKVITTTIPLVDFLLQEAGDVIRIERIGNKNRRVIVHAKHHFGLNSKENILREGSISTKATVAVAVAVAEKKV